MIKTKTKKELRLKRRLRYRSRVFGKPEQPRVCIFISNKSGVLMPSIKSKNEAKDFQELYPKSKWIELCWNKPNNNKKDNRFNPFTLVEEVK